MLKTIARKILELKRHKVEKVAEDSEDLIVWLCPDARFKPICSCCGSTGSGYDRLAERRGKHVPMWGIPVVLVYAPRPITCANCGVKVEAIPWSQGKSPLSLPLIVVLATWA